MKRLLFCFVIAAVSASVWANSVLDSTAAITDYSGDARVKPEAGGGAVFAELGRPLYEGDELTTKEGFIEITFDNASVMKLEENTSLTISSLEKKGRSARYLFSLAVGRIIAAVSGFADRDSGFEVRTKMALAAVKGTNFAVEADEDGTFVAVFDGEVTLETDESKEGVKEGFESFVDRKKRRPSKPERIKRGERFRKTASEVRKNRDRTAREGREGLRKRLDERSKKDSKRRYRESGRKQESRKEKLKNRLRSELNREKRSAYNDTAYINNEQRDDFRQGRVLTDVNGNRVRVEEHVIRPLRIFDFTQGDPKPENREINFVSLSKRDGRADAVYASYLFNKELPETVPKSAWNNIWKEADINDIPLHKEQEKISFINLDSGNKVSLDNRFTLLSSDYWEEITPPYGGEIVDFILVRDREMLSVNDISKENRWLFSLNSDDPEYSYNMGRMSNDPSNMTNPEETAPWGVSYEYVQPYSEEIVMPGGLIEKSITKNYNDGSFLKIDLYIIDDYGKQAAFPSDTSQWLSLMNTHYAQIVFSSSDFTGSVRNIDVVSKALWNIVLYPGRDLSLIHISEPTRPY